MVLPQLSKEVEVHNVQLQAQAEEDYKRCLPLGQDVRQVRTAPHLVVALRYVRLTV